MSLPPLKCSVCRKYIKDNDFFWHHPDEQKKCVIYCDTCHPNELVYADGWREKWSGKL